MLLMIDDLYDDRLATVDLALVAGGGALLVVGEWTGGGTVARVGGGGLAVGLAVFAANLSLVVWRHAPDALRRESTPATGSD